MDGHVDATHKNTIRAEGFILMMQWCTIEKRTGGYFSAESSSTDMLMH